MSKPAQFTCCICGHKHLGYGNNPEPVMLEFENGRRNRCCDNCNKWVVIPARIELSIRDKYKNCEGIK